MPRGVYERTPETRARMSAAAKSRKRCALSAETRARIGAAQQGKVLSAEHRAKLKATMVRRQVNVKHGHFVGRKPSLTYKSWVSMVQRCTNPNAAQYHYYGGRGITIYGRWRDSFVAFLEDMGERPEGKTLGRIDNDGSYEPTNCRWETQEEQHSNKRHCETCTCLVEV